MVLDKEQQRLVEENMALIYKVIHDRVHGAWNIGIFTYEDLYQIGCIGLCKAAVTDKFDYAHNRQKTHSDGQTCFTTYAYRLIWHEICSMLSYATKTRAESAAEPDALELQHREHTFGDEVGGIELQMALDEILGDATRSASGVTVKGIQALRYLAEGYTSTQIAEMMGAASCHHVTAWISKARKYLRSNPALQELYNNTA